MPLSYYYRRFFAVSVIATLLLMSFLAPARAEVPYITGGIGGEERERFELLRDEYNLQVKTAYSTGHYLADVEIVISNQSGLELLDAITEGPFFYARLPAGKYTATASFEGAFLTQTFSIVEGTPLREIVFRFKTDKDPEQ